MIGPNDSASAIGVKRHHELLEEELYSSPQDHNDGAFSESEESKHGNPQKRQKTGEGWSFSTRPVQESAEPLVIVAQTDAEAIKQLKEIEKSCAPDDRLSMKLQSLCAVLPQEAVSTFLLNFECPKIRSLIPLVLARASQLQIEQRAGIAYTCFAFGGLNWSGVVAMFTDIEDEA
jgi:hypothetical protein